MACQFETLRDYVAKDIELTMAMHREFNRMKKRGFHFLHRRSSTAPSSGNHAQSIGLRFGYWPCHSGPFVSIELLSHRWDIWWGTPSFERES